MAFQIEPTNRPEDRVGFNIGTNDGESYTISIPKSDCVEPIVMAELNEMYESVKESETTTMLDALRGEFKILSGHENDDMWDKLTERQLTQIRDHYRAESKTDLGESEASGS